jgi:hypothetical protein
VRQNGLSNQRQRSSGLVFCWGLINNMVIPLAIIDGKLIADAGTGG